MYMCGRCLRPLAYCESVRNRDPRTSTNVCWWLVHVYVAICVCDSYVYVMMLVTQLYMYVVMLMACRCHVVMLVACTRML